MRRAFVNFADCLAHNLDGVLMNLFEFCWILAWSENVKFDKAKSPFVRPNWVQYHIFHVVQNWHNPWKDNEPPLLALWAQWGSNYPLAYWHNLWQFCLMWMTSITSSMVQFMRGFDYYDIRRTENKCRTLSCCHHFECVMTGTTGSHLSHRECCINLYCKNICTSNTGHYAKNFDCAKIKYLSHQLSVIRAPELSALLLTSFETWNRWTQA